MQLTNSTVRLYQKLNDLHKSIMKSVDTRMCVHTYNDSTLSGSPINNPSFLRSFKYCINLFVYHSALLISVKQASFRGGKK